MCVWTARCTTLKNTQKVDIFEESELLRFSQNRNFRKLTTDFENRSKRQDASFWTLTTRPYLQSKFIPYCKRKFPPMLHTSGFIVKFWNFNNTVFMRKKNPENIIKTLYSWFKNTKNFGIFGLIVLSTQLHEEVHWLFLIAGNGDFRALSVDFISGLIATNLLGLLNHMLVSSGTFSGIFFLINIMLLKF